MHDALAHGTLREEAQADAARTAHAKRRVRSQKEMDLEKQAGAAAARKKHEAKMALIVPKKLRMSRDMSDCSSLPSAASHASSSAAKVLDTEADDEQEAAVILQLFVRAELELRAMGVLQLQDEE